MLTSVCANIFIDGSPLAKGFLGLKALASDKKKAAATRYEQKMDKLVQQLFEKPYRTGYWVLWAISHCGTRRGKKMVIRPDSEPACDDQHDLDAAPLGEDIFFNRDDDARTRKDERYDKAKRFWSRRPFKGTGKGSDVVILFDPDNATYRAEVSLEGPIATDPDEVLLHEMVHGLRSMQGRLLSMPTGAPGTDPFGYKDVEEFLAIQIVNIYMSEKGKTQLRGTHQSGNPPPLPSQYSTSAGFLTHPEHLKWVQYLWPQEPELFGWLANIQAAFNPIQEYARNRVKYLAPQPTRHSVRCLR